MIPEMYDNYIEYDNCETDYANRFHRKHIRYAGELSGNPEWFAMDNDWRDDYGM